MVVDKTGVYKTGVYNVTREGRGERREEEEGREVGRWHTFAESGFR